MGQDLSGLKRVDVKSQLALHFILSHDVGEETIYVFLVDHVPSMGFFLLNVKANFRISQFL
jgi:hypothetical protein